MMFEDVWKGFEVVDRGFWYMIRAYIKLLNKVLEFITCLTLRLRYRWRNDSGDVIPDVKRGRF
jgi:hypothetical protein